MAAACAEERSGSDAMAASRLFAVSESSGSAVSSESSPASEVATARQAGCFDVELGRQMDARTPLGRIRTDYDRRREIRSNSAILA